MADAYYHHPPPPFSSYPPPPPAYDYYPPPPPIPGVAPPPPHHQPPYPYYGPPPAAAPPPPQYYLHPPPPETSEEVRTLFVAGLPDDVQLREIYNLFREFPGFQTSQLRSAGTTRAYAFAVFNDQQSAVNAMVSLNGLVFDLEKESTLYIDLAKSNSRFKRSRNGDDVPYSPDKKFRAPAYSRSFIDSGVGSNIHMPGMGNSAYSTNGYPSTQSQTMYDHGTNKLNISPANYIPQNNNPCSTLFVANLGPACYEQELTAVFSRCQGFTKLKMQKKNGLPVAFVDFKNVDSSTGALQHLQGTVLNSSIGEGMRIEYAKAPMGTRGREKKR